MGETTLALTCFGRVRTKKSHVRAKDEQHSCYFDAMESATVELREHVASAARRLAAEKLVLGTAGNVSARSGELVAITPTGAALEELEAEQVAVVGLDGEQVGGELLPSSELGLHLGVYRRYDAGGVVHTHAPMATAPPCPIPRPPLPHSQPPPPAGS